MMAAGWVGGKILSGGETAPPTPVSLLPAVYPMRRNRWATSEEAVKYVAVGLKRFRNTLSRT